ncbi:MAG TPA: chloride channel protein [Acidimicrobiia bacterium]|nr:chloride channel protein [Acidimicrobiia bacterium]
MTKPLESIRRLPAVGVLAERQMGGFLAIAALVGVGVGLGAAALIFLVDWLEEFFLTVVVTQGRAWVFLTVPTGFLVAWFLARRFAPEIAGDGVPEAVAALEVHSGRMRARIIPLKTLATAITIGTGGSAGREGPIVQIGAAVGSVISRRFNLGEDQVRSLVAAGAGAGIGAAFNAPIAGMLFALEVILSSFAARHMSAIVIASITAAVTSRTIIGDELALQTGVYRLQSFNELILYAGLSLVVVAIGVIFLWMVGRLDGFVRPRARALGFVRPLFAGLIVAALIFIEPKLFGTGQSVINELLGGGDGSSAWWVLIVLALGKAIATSLTTTSGASGGAFMPSLFMGAAVGTGFALLVSEVWPSPVASGAFAVVGMAAMFAVVGRAPLTAILMVFEVTGARDYQLILPLMLTATLGTFLAERFHADSIYSLVLRHMGIKVRNTGEVDILDTIQVGTVMATSPIVCVTSDAVASVEERLHRTRSHGLPVLDGGRLVGVITLSDIARADSGEQTVAEAMTPRPATVVPSTPVSIALERMAVLGVGRLPVVDEEDPGRLVGVFRREDAVRAYHEALTSSTDMELRRARLAQRTDPGAGYYEFRIPPGSMADGRTIREVSWPEGSTLVSIRRERGVEVPTGDTLLKRGDVVTAFGTLVSKERMIQRLNAGADEPTAEIWLDEIEAQGDSSTTLGAGPPDPAPPDGS